MRANELTVGEEYAYDSNARRRYSRASGTDKTHVKVLKRHDEIEVEKVGWSGRVLGTVKTRRVLVQVMTSNTSYGGLGRKGKKLHVQAVFITGTWADELESRRLEAEAEAEHERLEKVRQQRMRSLRGRLRRVGLRPDDFSFTPGTYRHRDTEEGREFAFSVDAMERLLDRAGVK